MPTVTISPRAVFPDLKAMYQNYSISYKHIFLNKDLYDFREIVRKGNKSIHIYRCAKEMHTLKIHMYMYGFPFYIEGVYSVEEAIE